MSGIGSWLWGTSQLDDAVDKATSELLPAGSEDIALNLEICDQIRSKSVPAKDAMRALKRRLNHKNPNVQNLALSLTDACVKNGGDQFLAEIASREFIDNLVSILKIPALNMEVKNNILRMIQNWNFAFEAKPALVYVSQVYKTLTNEGFKFPPKDLAIANSAMVDTQTAPEWIDSDVCLRCRNPFTFTNRKHHCRNCGQVFDQACSSKSMPLPHFGITQEVRVCEGCYSKITRKAEKVDKGHRHSASVPTTRHRSARELADEELQRAIQLSLEEAGSAGHARPGYVPFQPPSWQYSEPPIVERSSRINPKSSANEEEDDPELKAAIEASLRDLNAPKPSAPLVIDSPRVESSYSTPSGYSQYVASTAPSAPTIPSYDLEPLESDAILTFSQTIDQVEAQGGRDISRYPAVNELYDKANSLRPKMALGLDDAGRKEQILSDMHDKLSQAVKLYDKILTEQVVHPRWRSTQAAASSSQQAHQAYSAANGYTQWASSVPVAASTYQPQASQWQPSSPPVQQYAPIPVQTPDPAPQEHQQSYVEVYQPQSSLASQTPVLPAVSINPQQYQYAAQSPPPPVSIQYTTSPPPPLQQQQQNATPASLPTSGLNRAKTVSLAVSPPPVRAAAQIPANEHLGRNNTVAATRPSTHAHSQSLHHNWAPPGHVRQQPHQQHLQQLRQQHIQQQQQIQQQLMQVPAPPSNVIPEFPVVPTGVPQQQKYAVYDGPGTGGMVQGERKEGLLIDL